MRDGLTTAIVGGGSAIAGGFLSGAYQHLRDHFSRPVLVIDFEGGKANKETSEYKEGDRLVSEIYIRARVRNTGHRVAKGCRVYVTAICEVLASGTTPSRLHDAKQLGWAGHDFSGLDVPRGVDFYADVVRISKSDPGWKFSVQRLFASQQELVHYRGTYRFYLLGTADNADPSTCEIDVTYDGDWHNLRAIRTGSTSKRRK